MDLPGLLLVLNLAATWYMTGLIWFVQLVHYAQFPLVGGDGFCRYHKRHTTFTTYAVGPPMLVEAATAILLVVHRPAFMPAFAAWAGIVLVGMLWLSTALLQVPKHNLLARGFDRDACGFLNRTNWIRTIGWTARGVMMAWVLTRGLSDG